VVLGDAAHMFVILIVKDLFGTHASGTHYALHNEDLAAETAGILSSLFLDKQSILFVVIPPFFHLVLNAAHRGITAQALP
jgi:hypothetical protein